MRKIFGIVLCLIMIFGAFGAMSTFAAELENETEAPMMMFSVLPEEKTLNFVGETFGLNTSVTTDLKEEDYTITFETSDAAVAVIDFDEVGKQYLVKATGAGEATVTAVLTATVNDSTFVYKDTCEVKVMGYEMTLEFDPDYIYMSYIGQTMNIQPQVEISPSDAKVNTNSLVFNYYTSNKDIVKVTKDGTITAVDSGTAMITVESAYNPEWVNYYIVEVLPRYSGADRYETAVQISKATYADGETANVVLAYGLNYPDALAAAPLASSMNAPILLTDGKTLTKEVAAEIERLGAQNIYIIGGESVISKELEDKLAEDYRVSRIYGANRYMTSLKIANLLFGKYEGFSEIFLVSGANYPDALTISSIAARIGAPILYVGENGELSNEILNFIVSTGCEKVTIIGGESVVLPSVNTLLENKNITNVSRYGGADRYETALKVNKAYGFEANVVCLATGNNYPDALTGSVLCARYGYNLMIVPNQVSEKIVKYCADKNIVIFGGTKAIPHNVIEQIVD